MKASELAIGDWVCVAGPVINGEERLTPPMRVVAIGETWVQLLIDPEAGDPDEYDIEDIRPIPLTGEMLWKNFKEWEVQIGLYRKGWKISIEYRNQMVYVSFRNSKQDRHFPDGKFNTSILFVHELQHALRLAGIEKEIEL